MVETQVPRKDDILLSQNPLLSSRRLTLNRSLASSSASGNVLLTSSFSVSSDTFSSSEDDDVEEIEDYDFLSFFLSFFLSSVKSLSDKFLRDALIKLYETL
jgi:hypothetical protein